MTRFSRLTVVIGLMACSAHALEAQRGRKPRPDLTTSAMTMAAVTPLASHPQAEEMLREATQKAAALDLNFKFLNKTYENDVYVTDPLGEKHRVSCVRFRATSGFRFKLDVPSFTLTTQGLRVVQNVSSLTADGLTVKVQFGPCTDITAGVGIRLSDIKLVYTARPMISYTEGKCQVSWSREHDDLNISIGDLNITGVQNDIDKLAKDATREALNSLIDGYFGGRLRSELLKISVNTCGGGKSGR